MPTNTIYFGLIQPLVNNAQDKDVWGGYVNTNSTTLDTTIKQVCTNNLGSTDPKTLYPLFGNVVTGMQWLNNSASTWPLQIYDGSQWVTMGTLDPTAHIYRTNSGFLNAQVFSSTGGFTYTPSVGMTFCIVELIGAGGGGGGVQGQGASAGGGAAQGGGAGGYCRSLLTAAQIGASQSGFIGTGGTGGSGTGNGNVGTASTFGAGGILMTANGGSAGGGINSGLNNGYSVVVFGANSDAIGGNMVNAKGQAGLPGISMSNQFCVSGAGGNSYFGAGGSAVGHNNINGNNAVSPGAGGSGAANLTSSSAFTGGNGANGICIITEFGI